jgi:hypothetical protein
MYTNIRGECGFRTSHLLTLYRVLDRQFDLYFGVSLSFRPYISITLKETTDGPFTELHFL